MKYLVAYMNIVLGDNHVQNTQALVSFFNIRVVSQGTPFFPISTVLPQALVSFQKYMPPPLPYFKVNIYPFILPHFTSIFFAYL
jgi:hypothetical protein